MSQKRKYKILICASYFLPGFRAGGPIKSIKNICQYANQDAEFFVLTRNYDVKKTDSYDLPINTWTKKKYFKIKYIKSFFFYFFSLKKDLEEIKPDLIYANSFFDIFLYLHYIFYFSFSSKKNIPILIAPRGEFSPGAKKIKKIRKFLYLKLVNFFPLYRNIFFHATSDYEKTLINKNIKQLSAISSAGGIIKNDVLVAENIPNFNDTPKKSIQSFKDEMNICFISRISKMKNLPFALDVLKHVNTKYSFTIYGPIEDYEEWEICKAKIKKIKNFSIKYKGAIKASDVYTTLLNFDLLFVPSRGENFGHIFIESLEAGVPVLTSDQTPWTWVNDEKAGGAFTLSNFDRYVKFLESYSSREKRHRYHINAINAYQKFLKENNSIEETKYLFKSIIDN